MAFAMMARRLAASRLGADAAWQSRDGGPTVAVRVVLSRPEATFGGGGQGGGRQAIAALATVAAAALPGRPASGDLLAVGTLSYRVAGEPQQDETGSSYTLPLRIA